MKTFIAAYFDRTKKVVHVKSFEAKNRKEAWAMAQQYKKQTPEIRNVGRVRTLVLCKPDVIKKYEKLLHTYNEYQHKKLEERIPTKGIDFNDPRFKIEIPESPKVVYLHKPKIFPD